MKTYEDRTETITRRVEVATLCDFCGADVDDQRLWEMPDGTFGTWCENAVTLGHRFQHSHYPDGGESSTLEIDCCPSCFTSRVLPALRAAGLNPAVAYRDFTY